MNLTRAISKMRYKFPFLFILLAAVCSCSHQNLAVENAKFLMFSDTLYVFPVTEQKAEFEIPVVAMGKLPYDRTLAVEVVE